MTDAQCRRICELYEKMDAAKAKADRTYTDTADLTTSEQRELLALKKLQQAYQDEWESEQLAKLNRSQLSSFMPHDIQTFDGAF